MNAETLAVANPQSPFSTARDVQQTRPDVLRYFDLERRPPSRYAGQLTAEFQAALAAHHAGARPDECDFYHTIETANGRVIEGTWDLRGHEAAYLGHVGLSGRRVLEVGPASGWLSAYVASQGADLTVFDLPLGATPELVPQPSMDMDEVRRSAAISVGRLVKSWWYARNVLGFHARAVYADIYAPPSDLGRFDVTVFGSILLHLSNPFRALERMAEITDDTIVVTDVFSAPTAGPIAELRGQSPALALFNPTPPPIGLIHWWALSPDVISRMLSQLGFADITVTTHTPPRMDSRPPMFTVVGRRPRQSAIAAPPRDELPMPPGWLRFLVSGTEDEAIFNELGRKGFDAIVNCLQRNGASVDSLERVLDFGCGCGRVIRHWNDRPNTDVCGTDISADAIEWASSNLTFAAFSTNEGAPPLPYTRGYFDLIYTLSVFTHLPASIQEPWFAELARLLRPGGYLYLTAHGQHYNYLLDNVQRVDFAAGRLVVTGDERPGSNHCAAFHPRSYVQRRFADANRLELLEHMPCGADGNPQQDSYLFRKPPGFGAD